MTKQIVNANTIPSLVREAFRIAEEEKPGPVLLELPEDIAEEAAEMVDLIPPGERGIMRSLVLRLSKRRPMQSGMQNGHYC